MKNVIENNINPEQAFAVLKVLRSGKNRDLFDKPIFRLRRFSLESAMDKEGDDPRDFFAEIIIEGDSDDVAPGSLRMFNDLALRLTKLLQDS